MSVDIILAALCLGALASAIGCLVLFVCMVATLYYFQKKKETP